MIGFLPDSYQVNEADGVVTLSIVKRSQTSARVTVQIITRDGSATGTEYTDSWTCVYIAVMTLFGCILNHSLIALTDYMSVTREVVFEAHEVVKEVQVMIQQDSLSENLEMFTATLVAQDGGGSRVIIGEDGVAMIAIEDDDSK